MLYLVTNRRLAGKRFYKVIEESLAAGLDYLILREKDLDYDSYLELAKKVKDLTDTYSVPLILNGNLRIAQEIGAYAYHSPYQEFIESGKSYRIQGVSIHSLEEALEAERLGADYLLAGHIFETRSKLGLEGRGLDFIREIRGAVNIPLIAIGGIGPERSEELAGLGLDGLAVMSYIMASKDGVEATRRMKSSMNANRRKIDV